MFVIYATDRNDRVRKVAAHPCKEKVARLVAAHNREEAGDWVETGHRGEQWSYIPAAAWEDFREMWNTEESMSALLLAR